MVQQESNVTAWRYDTNKLVNGIDPGILEAKLTCYYIAGEGI
jgi:hypothetical protein